MALRRDAQERGAERSVGREGLPVDLTASIAATLGPRYANRFVPEPSPAAEVVRCRDLLDSTRLGEAIDRCAFADAEPQAGAAFDRRAAASRWSRHYAGTMLQAVLVAMALGVGLDASLDRASVVMMGTIPRGLHLSEPLGGVLLWPPRLGRDPGPGRVAASLTDLHAHVLSRVMAGNVMPMLERVLEVVKVSPRMLRCNVAEQVEGVYERAREALGSGAEPFVEDHRAVVESPSMPGVPGPNPLADTMEWDRVDEPGFPDSLHRRHVCCITFILPDRPGRYCWNCPLLPLSERVALARADGIGRPVEQGG